MACHRLFCIGSWVKIFVVSIVLFLAPMGPLSWMYHIATTADNLYVFHVTCGNAVDGFSAVENPWDRSDSWYPTAENLSLLCHETAHKEAADLKIEIDEVLHPSNEILSRLLIGIGHNFGFVDFAIALLSFNTGLVLISISHDVFMSCCYSHDDDVPEDGSLKSKPKRAVGVVLLVLTLSAYTTVFFLLLRSRLPDLWQFFVEFVGLIFVLAILVSWSCTRLIWPSAKRDFAHMATVLSIVLAGVCFLTACAGMAYAIFAQHVVIISPNVTIPVPESISPSANETSSVLIRGQCKCEWPLETAERLTGLFSFFVATVAYVTMAFGWSVRLWGTKGSGTTLLHFASHLPYSVWRVEKDEGFLNLHNDLVPRRGHAPIPSDIIYM